MKTVTGLMRAVTQSRRKATEVGAWRARAALAGVVAACMTVTVVAVSGTGTSNAGTKFIQSGHYVYNRTLGVVFHINGDTKAVDGQVPVPKAGPSTRVVQTDKGGYVLSEGSTTEFFKSDLRVADPLPAPAAEPPIGLEAAGAAYAIYRQAGKVLRLGENPTVVVADGPLGQSVATADGTLWVHGATTGQLCRLPLDADRLSCTAKVPAGHGGSLTLVGDQPVFVDTTAREMRAVGNDGLGRVVPLTGVEVAPGAIVATHDVGGRVAILDPRKNVLQLVDTAGLTTARPTASLVVKQLKPGRYEQLVSSGQGLALINSTEGTLVTLDREGDQQSSRKLPTASKQAALQPAERPRLVRGADSRIYLDSQAGEHVMVVEGNGQVTEVKATGPAVVPEKKPTSKPAKPTVPEKTVAPPSSLPTRRPVEPIGPPAKVKPQEPPRTVRPVEPSKTLKPVRQPRTERPAPPPTTKPPTTKPPVTLPPKPTVNAGRPGAPGPVSVVAGNAAATVSWGAAPANGAPITSYVVSWAGDTRPFAGSLRRASITGLTNGNSYSFTVRAVNRVGTGPGVSATRITLGGPADAPVNLRATPTSGGVTLSWVRPNLNGGKLLRYGVTIDGQPENTATTTYRATGLTNGKRYAFIVTAVTTTPDGRILVGAIATVSATPGAGSGGQGTLRISKGTAVDSDPGDCRPGRCFNIHIVAAGLRPSTDYMLQGNNTSYGELHPGGPEAVRSNAQGVIDVQKFYNDESDGQVWVTATGPDIPPISNRVDW